MKTDHRAALKIVLIYAAAAGLWIFFSDQLLFLFTANPTALRWFETYKGLGFVLFTAGGLFLLLNRELSRRRRFADALQRSEQRYRGLLEQAADGIFLLGLDGRYLDANAAGVQMLGYPLDELRRCHVSDLIHPDDLRTTPVDFTGLLEGQTVRLERRMRRRDGSYVPLEISARRIDQDILQGIARDISGRRQSEALIERQVAHLQALHTIERAITASIDLQQTLAVVLEQARQLLEVDAGAVLLYDPDRQMLQAVGVSGFHISPQIPFYLDVQHSLAGRAVLHGSLQDRSLAPELPASPMLQGEGFQANYALPLIVRQETVGVLEVFHRRPLQPEAGWLELLQALADPAATAIQHARLYENLERYSQQLTAAYDKTLAAWSAFLELRDRETQGHSRSVTELSLQLAHRMGFAGEALEHLRRGALLHDIGKMGVPDSILLKAGPLSEAEWEVMRRHPVYAYEMLQAIDFLQPALDVPYCHHERWNGAGYPNGLRGEQIPLAARIFAVIDVWDALCSDRPYRPAWPAQQAQHYIQERAGVDFDPRVVTAFLEMIKQADRRRLQ
ncbi:MAG: HD domain-containing phosphohydrolase [Chloroflexota bacterium]